MRNRNLLLVFFRIYSILLFRGRQFSDKAIVAYCLTQKLSYRLPATAAEDRLIGLRVFFRVLRKFFGRRVDYKILNDGPEGIAILNGDFRYMDLVVNYVKKQSRDPIRLVLAKEFLACRFNWLQAPFFLTIFCIFSIPFIIISFFSKRRSGYALLITEAVENASLLSILHEQKVKTLLDFMPYEKDGNLMSYLLVREGIKVVKLPSPGPLSLHNSLLLGTELVLSNQYQFEEYELLKKEGIKIGTLRKWLPEFAFEYIDLYRSAVTTSSTNNVIAYYSHGSWLRKKQNHARTKLRISDDEVQILGFLNAFIKKYPGFSLKIYLHPREKHADHQDETRKFYAEHLPDITFQYSSGSKKTALCFNESNVAVCAYSSVIYERLFCGFKTLIGLPCSDGFPMAGSRLNEIVFKTGNQMEEKLLRILDLTNDKFFENYRLQEYVYYNYPYFKDGSVSQFDS